MTISLNVAAVILISQAIHKCSPSSASPSFGQDPHPPLLTSTVCSWKNAWHWNNVLAWGHPQFAWSRKLENYRSKWKPLSSDQPRHGQYFSFGVVELSFKICTNFILGRKHETNPNKLQHKWQSVLCGTPSKIFWLTRSHRNSIKSKGLMW